MMLPFGNDYRARAVRGLGRASREAHMECEASGHAYRFRVYHFSINGATHGAVPAWRLALYLRDIKVLNAYAAIVRLEDGATLTMSVRVYGQAMDLDVKASTWRLHFS